MRSIYPRFSRRAGCPPVPAVSPVLSSRLPQAPPEEFDLLAGSKETWLFRTVSAHSRIKVIRVFDPVRKTLGSPVMLNPPCQA